MRAWLLALPLLLPLAARGQTCADGPSGQVFTFEMPPPPGAPVRDALRAGRAYLRRGADRAVGCAEAAADLPGGYVVATLSRGRVAFSAPEEIPPGTLTCLAGVVRRLGPVPAALRAGPGRGRSREAPPELSALWVLHPPAAPPGRPAAPQETPANGKRSFAEIEREVQRHLPALASCFEELWEERPHATGTLVLRLLVLPSGAVEEAVVHRREPTMQAAEACVLRVAERLRFPARWEGGRSALTYPLVLSGPVSAPTQEPAP